MRLLTVLILSSANVLAIPAAAHGLFWQEAPGGWVLMEGHQAGHGHDGEATGPLPSARVAAVRIGTCGGGWAAAGVPAEFEAVVLPADDAVFALVDWGWWTRSAAGTVNAHPGGVAGALQAWTSRETVKHLVRPCAAGLAPAGVGLEVSPVGGLSGLAVGDKLTVVVTLDGAPQPGAVVTCDGRARGASGDDGTVRLKLREPGRQVIRASLRRPAADPAWAEDVRTATLTFDLGTE